MNTRIVVGSVVIVALIALLLGCEPTGPVTSKGVLSRTATNPPLPPPPPGTTPASTTPATPPEAAPPVDAPQRANPFERGGSATPAASTPSTAAETPGTDSTSKPSIRLSVGIALPQTLPDGTQVGVSVDYKLIKGQLNKSAKYIWVIETGRGETGMEVELKPQGGNLANFLPISIQPGDGPFKARIDEVSTSGSRTRVSNVEPLR